MDKFNICSCLTVHSLNMVKNLQGKYIITDTTVHEHDWTACGLKLKSRYLASQAKQLTWIAVYLQICCCNIIIPNQRNIIGLHDSLNTCITRSYATCFYTFTTGSKCLTRLNFQNYNPFWVTKGCYELVGNSHSQYYCYHNKQQIILQRKCHSTKLIFMAKHKLLHAGLKLLPHTPEK